MCLIGAFNGINRSRNRRRTNHENPRKNRGNPGKIQKKDKDKRDKKRTTKEEIGKPPRLKPRVYRPLNNRAGQDRRQTFVRGKFDRPIGPQRTLMHILFARQGWSHVGGWRGQRRLEPYPKSNFEESKDEEVLMHNLNGYKFSVRAFCSWRDRLFGHVLED